MKTMNGSHAFAVGFVAALVSALFSHPNAFAGVTDDTSTTPPGGWKQLCAGNSIKVTPQTDNRRHYQADGTCWMNTAQDKTHLDHQTWVQVRVSLNGTYDLSGRKFNESVAVNTPSGARTVGTSGVCSDDPWITNATCSATDPSQNLNVNFGWHTLGLKPGPLSRNVFSADLVQAILNKQESKPPLAPLGLDSVRWPVASGEMGEVKWRAADMSDNKWVLQFDIEYANYADATFTKAGQRVGPGPKKNFSAADANTFYVFMTPFKLQTSNYYFRVCASNDAGRECSAPVLARKPTKQELMAAVGNAHVAAGPITPPAGSGTPAAGGAKPTGPVALGTGRPGVSTGGNAPTAIGTARSIGPVAGVAPRPSGGGDKPGTVAIPDLAVGRGMTVHDQMIAWGGMANLALRADATLECPLAMSFQYMNVGKGPATNVTAEIRDNLHPTQPVATQSVASLTAGQSSTVGGVLKVGAQPAPRQVIVAARVHEAGKIQETNTANDHGSVTLNVTCRR